MRTGRGRVITPSYRHAPHCGLGLPENLSPSGCAHHVERSLHAGPEGEPGERFYVLLSGMLAVSQEGFGRRRVLRPGDYFGEVALAMDIPRTASVRAVTPALVASCDKATFDELLRPLFAEDE